MPHLSVVPVGKKSCQYKVRIVSGRFPDVVFTTDKKLKKDAGAFIIPTGNRRQVWVWCTTEGGHLESFLGSFTL